MYIYIYINIYIYVLIYIYIFDLYDVYHLSTGFRNQPQELKRVLIEARLAGAPMDLIDRGPGKLRGKAVDGLGKRYEHIISYKCINSWILSGKHDIKSSG